MQEKYPWLDQSEERKYMSDREILDKYVDLDKSCLSDAEKNRLWICFSNTKKHSV